LLNSAFAAQGTGRLEEALAECERLRTLTDGDPRIGFAISGLSAASWTRMQAAQMFTVLGRFDEAGEAWLEAIRFDREHELSENLVWSLGFSSLAWFMGSAPPGLPDFRAAAIESVGIADRLDIPHSRISSRYNCAWAHRTLGEHAACADAAREAIAVGEEHSAMLDWSFASFCFLAHALRSQGDPSGALEAATRAAELADRIGHAAWGIDALLELALALLAAKGAKATDQADAQLARAEAWLAKTGARAFEPMILEARAELARVRGNDDARERLRSEALRVYRELGASGHATRLAAELS
jgi:tetratricopeptide (TPR) repeat protein